MPEMSKSSVLSSFETQNLTGISPVSPLQPHPLLQHPKHQKCVCGSSRLYLTRMVAAGSDLTGRNRSETAVLIDTSLGTHVALSVPPDAPAAHLVGEVERAHFDCFPSFGQVKVHALMVKYKSCFYHLAPSMPLKCAFRGSSKAWFVYADAVSLGKCPLPDMLQCVSAEDGCRSSNASIECEGAMNHESGMPGKCEVNELKGIDGLDVGPVTPILNENDSVDGARDNNKNVQDLESENICPSLPAKGDKLRKPYEPSAVSNGSSEDLSTTLSIADIIRRHCSEVEATEDRQGRQKARSAKYCAASPVSAYTPPRSAKLLVLQNAGSGKLSSEVKRPDVGQRILMASAKLGIRSLKSSPIVSMYKSKGRKQFGVDCRIKNPVFDVSDDSR